MFKRVHPRVLPRKGEPVRVQIMGDGFLDVLHARDISVGGIGVVVPHRFVGCDISSQVEIVIRLPGHSPFMARGIVRHRAADTPFFGIEIVHISPENARRLERYVDGRLADGGGVS